VRIELLREVVAVEGVSRLLVVVFEALMEQLEVGFALGFVASEASVDGLGV